MAHFYSAHPVLAAEQLNQIESELNIRHNRRQSRNFSIKSTTKPNNNKKCITNVCKALSEVNPTLAEPPVNEAKTSTAASKVLNPAISGKSETRKDKMVEDNFPKIQKSFTEKLKKVTLESKKTKVETKTKDCIDKDTVSVDEIDHVQKRSSRNKSCIDRNFKDLSSSQNRNEFISSDACASSLSSTVSSQSNSNMSSPFCTPTRLVPLQNLQPSNRYYCSKMASPLTPIKQQQYHRHQNYNDYLDKATGGSDDGLKNKKFDTRLNPSPYRQLLPIALCILSFATVFATLIVYMDTTEIRHQQFRLNMSRDYELNGVAQDDPHLIAFLRQIHMRKYAMNSLKTRQVIDSVSPSTLLSTNIFASSKVIDHLNFSSESTDNILPAMTRYVTDVVGGKMNGAVIQSLTGPLAHLITAPWLSESLNWMGILIEPEPRWYFTLRKQNAQRSRMQVVHACVSPNTFPKEISIQNEDIRINSLQDEESSWFNSRVKCFPLYTIMLACDRVEFDLLSLGVQGHELEILQTLPFDKIKIDIISIHLEEDPEDDGSYIQSITKFLFGKSYRLQKTIKRNYFYQRIDSINRSRKKDMVQLKTP